MNKLTMMALATGMTMAAMARPTVKMTPELYGRTGGQYEVPGSMQGEICLANCNSGAEDAWLREVADYLHRETDLNVTCTNGCAFAWPQPKRVGDFTVFVVDDKSLPSVLVATEDKWAAVNVARLRDVRPQFFALRVKKELVRTFSQLCGGASSNYQGGLSGPVRSLDDLDKKLDYRLQVDVRERILKYVREYGVIPQITTTYLAACRHGVAPAPTNEVQKVIWEKVKAEANAKPSNPMKITKEKK